MVILGPWSPPRPFAYMMFVHENREEKGGMCSRLRVRSLGLGVHVTFPAGKQITIHRWIFFCTFSIDMFEISREFFYFDTAVCLDDLDHDYECLFSHMTMMCGT